jgi:hypothetical protein
MRIAPEVVLAVERIASDLEGAQPLGWWRAAAADAGAITPVRQIVSAIRVALTRCAWIIGSSFALVVDIRRRDDARRRQRAVNAA